MKKSFVGPLLVSIAILLMAAMFVYFYISLNRMDKQLVAVQQSVVDDSTKLTAIVNFFNTAANATPTK